MRKGLQFDGEPLVHFPNRTQDQIRKIRRARSEGGYRWGGSCNRAKEHGIRVHGLNMYDTLFARWEAHIAGSNGAQLLRVKAPYFGGPRLPLP